MKHTNAKLRSRPATNEEILKFLIGSGMVVVDRHGKYRMTLAGLRYAAERPPHVVTDYIPSSGKALKVDGTCPS